MRGGALRLVCWTLETAPSHRAHLDSPATSAPLVPQDGKEIQRSFKHISSSVGAFEAEEVGVEHLLRDVNDPSVSTLANLVRLAAGSWSPCKVEGHSTW